MVYMCYYDVVLVLELHRQWTNCITMEPCTRRWMTASFCASRSKITIKFCTR